MLSGDDRFSHFAGDTALSHTGLVFFFNPDLAVAIFFVLSGFVLSYSVSETSSQLLPLVVRRWIRLGGPVLAASLFAWAIAAAQLNFGPLAAQLSKSVWLAGQYAHITLTAGEFTRLVYQSAISLMFSQNAGGEIARYYNSNLWTMPIEFIGSIGIFVAYILILPVARGFWQRFALVAAAVILCWNSPFYGFPLGAALFEIHRALVRRGQTPMAPTRVAAAVAGGVFLSLGVVLGGMPFAIDLQHPGIYAPLALGLNGWLENPITALHHLAAVCLVAAALLLPPLQAVLQSRPIQFLGRISFMVYLVQIPVLCSLGSAMVFLLAPACGYNTATAVAAVTYIAAVLAIATVLTRLSDQPAVRASRWAGKALDRRMLRSAIRRAEGRYSPASFAGAGGASGNSVSQPPPSAL